MRRRTLIIIVTTILVVGLGYWWYVNYSPSKPEATPPPEEEEVARVVSATGVVVPARWATLSFKIGGRVEEVLVEAGTQAQEGEVLIQLEATDLEYAVLRAQAAVAVSQASLAQLEAGARSQEIASAQASLEGAEAELQRLLKGPSQEEIVAAKAAMQEAEVALQLAQAQYDKVAWLPDVGATPQAVALQQATSRYQIAKANYEALIKGPSEEEIAAARSRVSHAQAQLDLLMAGASPEEVAVAQAQLEEAKIVLAQAEAALSEASLRAPFAGTIGAVKVREGEMVLPGAPVITLGDLSHLRVETTDLNEVDVPLVRVGQEVKVEFDALPEKVIRGQVAHIAPQATMGEGGTNYLVIIELEVQDPDLRWGMTAFVDIVVE